MSQSLIFGDDGERRITLDAREIKRVMARRPTQNGPFSFEGWVAVMTHSGERFTLLRSNDEAEISDMYEELQDAQRRVACEWD